MAVYENSRYLQTTLYSRIPSKTTMFQLRQRHNFNEDNYTSYQWIDGDSLDGVAYKFYVNCALRWAILDSNPNYRTEWDIENGDVINIADYEEVVELVNGEI